MNPKNEPQKTGKPSARLMRQIVAWARRELRLIPGLGIREEHTPSGRSLSLDVPDRRFLARLVSGSGGGPYRFRRVKLNDDGTWGDLIARDDPENAYEANAQSMALSRVVLMREVSLAGEYRFFKSCECGTSTSLLVHVDDCCGRDESSATITIRPLTGSPPVAGSIVASGTTDAAGLYGVALPAGTYRVTVVTPEYTTVADVSVVGGIVNDLSISHPGCTGTVPWNGTLTLTDPWGDLPFTWTGAVWRAYRYVTCSGIATPADVQTDPCRSCASGTQTTTSIRLGYELECVTIGTQQVVRLHAGFPICGGSGLAFLSPPRCDPPAPGDPVVPVAIYDPAEPDPTIKTAWETLITDGVGTQSAWATYTSPYEQAPWIDLCAINLNLPPNLSFPLDLSGLGGSADATVTVQGDGATGTPVTVNPPRTSVEVCVRVHKPDCPGPPLVEGDPIAGATVEILPLAGGTALASGTSDVSGNVCLTVSEAGPHKLKATLGDCEYEKIIGINFCAASITEEIPLCCASDCLTVLHLAADDAPDATPTPLADATVTVTGLGERTTDDEGEACVDITTAQMLSLPPTEGGDCSSRDLTATVSKVHFLDRCFTTPVLCGDAGATGEIVVYGLQTAAGIDVYNRLPSALATLCPDTGCANAGWIGRGVIPVGWLIAIDVLEYEFYNDPYDHSLGTYWFSLRPAGFTGTVLYLDTDLLDGNPVTPGHSPFGTSQRAEWRAYGTANWEPNSGGGTYSTSWSLFLTTTGARMVLTPVSWDPDAPDLPAVLEVPSGLPETPYLSTDGVMFKMPFTFDPCDFEGSESSVTVTGAITDASSYGEITGKYRWTFRWVMNLP